MYTHHQYEQPGRLTGPSIHSANSSRPPPLQRSPGPQASPIFSASRETHHQHYSREPSPHRPLYAQPPSQPHFPSSNLPAPADTIKCSSCASWVHLERLGDHVCGQPSRGPTRGDQQRRTDACSAKELRVDVQAAGPRQYGHPPPQRSPLYPGHLEPTPPHTPGSSLSRPTSPALSSHSDHLSHSFSSNSSASSSVASASSTSRMPFFERYNKLVGAGNAAGYGDGPSGGNMAGVGMRNLDLSLGSPRSETFAPDPRGNRTRSPSPNPAPFASSPSHLYHQPHSPRPEQSLGPQFPSYSEPRQSPTTRPKDSPNLPAGTSRPLESRTPQARPDTQSPHRDGSELLPRMAPPERALTSLATISAPGPVLPQSAPQVNGLARSSSNSSSLNSVESAYIAYDRRDTLKPSPPNPTITKSPSTKSNTSQGGGSISSLDALEDLLLMAREEAADDDGLVKDANGAQALLEDFLAPSRSKNRDLGRSRSDHEEIDDVSATPRAPTRIPGSKSVPSLAPFSSSPSTARTRGLPTSESSPNLSAALGGSATSFDCTTCRIRLKPSQIQKAGDGQLFCRECYAERYLPKCRKCTRAIEGGAVTSSDGKVVGKYHPGCFSCFSCSRSFPSGDFYVYDGKPYCQYDYHLLNGSLCANPSCGVPIEGPCVSLVGEENGGGGRYHPNCFVCAVSTCSAPLLEHHFVVERLPYCEVHSNGTSQLPVESGPRLAGSTRATSRAKKRQTIITKAK